MKNLSTITLFILFGGLLYWGLTTSLEDMTRTDCEIHEIEKACEQLND